MVGECSELARYDGPVQRCCYTPAATLLHPVKLFVTRDFPVQRRCIPAATL
jgi:hypothetical protein